MGAYYYKFMKRNILITGATSGIGRCLVDKLSCDQNHLVLIGRSADRLSEIEGQLKFSCTTLAVDLADINQLSSQIQLLPNKIDGFVHAAGVESVEPIKLVNYVKFDYIMRLHLYSFVEIVKYIDKCKKKTDTYDTSVVAISSIASSTGGVGQTMYSSSKAALEAATRVLCKELSSKSIRINSIKPGIVDTEMTRRWMRRIGLSDISEVDRMQLNGTAKPEDVANLVAFLLSDESRHIVGAEINIDGGGPAGKIF